MIDEDDWTEAVDLRPPTAKLKDNAHKAFDPLWQSGRISRKFAYEMLAAALGVSEPEAHMRVMSRENLERVPAISRRLAQIVVKLPRR